MPYEIRSDDGGMTIPKRDKRTCLRLKAWAVKNGCWDPDTHIYYISPDGSTRELIE